MLTHSLNPRALWIDCHPHKRFAEIAIFSEWMRDENCLNEHALHPTFMRTCRCRGTQVPGYHPVFCLARRNAL